MKQAISYRDNSGFVILKNDSVFRFVSREYAAQYDMLMQSGLYQELVDEGLLIPHRENLMTAQEKAAYHKVLVPERIFCITYPYEWTTEQWKQVLLQFLQINTMALRYGMILKDATPFNFSFQGRHCIFIDTLSYEFYKEGTPWIAYRQFCESMLGPFALMTFNHDNWGRYLSASINGFELPFISRNLKRRSWFDLTAVLHLHWHAKYTDRDGGAHRSSMSRQKLQLLWSMLRRGIGKWKTKNAGRRWTKYYDIDIASTEYMDDKTAQLVFVLQALQPRSVIDLGANTGRFSLLAARYAGQVIAVEADQACVRILQEQLAAQSLSNITTILADIVVPTPGLGWNNSERLPLLHRLQGELVMALALVHHLCIARNIPIEFVAEMLAAISLNYAVVEFIPKSDPKVAGMLAGREDIFNDYHEESFIHHFSRYFVLMRSHAIASSGRTLFIWKKK